MASHKNKSSVLIELIAQLDHDRSWILEQIDQGSWSAYRLELASLERELAQLLMKLSERLEDEK